MKFKRKHLAEALNMNNRGVKHFTKNKLQKVIVSEEQLNRLMSNLIEQDEKDPNLPGGTNQTKNKDAAQSRDRGVQELINDKVNWNAMSKNEQNAAMGEGYTSTTWSEKINEETVTEDAKPDFLDLDGDGDKEESMKKAAKDKKEMDEGKKKDHDGDGDIDSDDYLAAKDKAIKKAMKKDVKEDSEGEETYHYGEDEGRDEYRLKHDHMSKLHRHNLEKDEAYDEDHEFRHERGTHFYESKKLTTTTPITESEVKEISKFMGRMNTTGKNYNPAPKASKSISVKVEELHEDINRTYRAIRRTIIKENNVNLDIKDYQEVLSEGFNTGGPNPGVSAAAGIENIIDNVKRAYSYVKDSRTRKQIMNTLVKLNNFMTYSAELIGSGRDQRAARSYDDVSKPLPYPEVDEPEALEDIDDELMEGDEEIDEFKEMGMFEPGDGADDESYDGHHFKHDVIGAYDDDLTGKARKGEVY